jgi:hypothetical protein
VRILQAVLGLDVMGFERRVSIDSPTIPPWLQWLRIEDLKVGDSSIPSPCSCAAQTTAT